MRIFTLLLFVLVSSCTIFAQTAVSVDVTSKNTAMQNDDALQERGSSTGVIIKTVNIYPNPCPERILHVVPVHVTITSYQVFKSTGEIVEIENLIGKDDRFDIIILGSIPPGLYFVTFQTDAGPYTKYFMIP